MSERASEMEDEDGVSNLGGMRKSFRLKSSSSVQGEPQRVAVIVGASSKHDKDGAASDMPPEVRWGLGGALCHKFAIEGYHVVLMGRRVVNLCALRDTLTAASYQASILKCDVTDADQVKSAFAKASEIGNVDVVIFNVGFPMPEGRGFHNLPLVHEIDPAYFNRAFDVGVTGCLRVAREVIPRMLDRDDSRSPISFLISGATMALRGGKSFGSMSPAKFALRSLSQSMFQEYAPKGIHVCHIIIDGVIDSPATRPWGAKVQLMNPKDLASEYYRLHMQRPTVWSYESHVGPHRDSVGMRM